MELVPIPSQTVGPFFHLGCTQHQSVGTLASADTKGERIQLICRIFDGDGSAVPDAMIEIWQANAEGRYNHPEDLQDRNLNSFRGFGRLATNNEGICAFTTIRPGQVPANEGTLQASHINVSVFARGVLARLATRIYFAGDPATSNDSVLVLVPAERRNTLLAKQTVDRSDEWHFDIHLCGEHETVFFDI
jgi:protocatechuate 3,4-dioxygenase, alpha subunit